MSPCGGKGGGEGVEMAKVLHQLTRLASTSCRLPATSDLSLGPREACVDHRGWRALSPLAIDELSRSMLSGFWS